MSECFVNSVAEFVEEAVSWKIKGYAPTAFRGQSYSEWKTLPKIFRPDVKMYDGEHFAVRDIVTMHPHEFDSDKTMFDRLVRMQHFELPTRLLDVTANPLVALWFASQDHKEKRKLQDGKVQAFYLPPTRCKYYDSDRVSCMSNLANIKTKTKQEIFKMILSGARKEDFNKSPPVLELLYNIRMEKPHFIDVINPAHLVRPVYVKPKLSNKRIIAQSGAFLIYGMQPGVGKSSEEPMRTERLIVPAKAKRRIRKELEMLGINASTLFPEFDKAAQFIMKRFQDGPVTNDSDLLV